MKEQIFKHSLYFVIVPAIILAMGTVALISMDAPTSYKLMSAVLSVAFIAGGIIIYIIKINKIDRGDYCYYKGVINNITLRSYRSFVFEVSVRLENGGDMPVYVIGLNRLTVQEGLACEVIEYGPVLGFKILKDEIIIK